MDSDRLVTRPYRTALAIAITLVFITLTAVIILLIITSAREDEREQEFSATLTAARHSAQQTIDALETAPTPAPEVIAGRYPFALEVPGPRYSAAPEPESQLVHGLILNDAGQPLDGIGVIVWGDYTPLQSLATGEPAGQEAGRWALALKGQINRRVWVQLAAGGRYLSAPVEVVFEETDGARSAAELVFRQTGPLS